MKPIEPYIMKSIELATCTSSGISYAGSTCTLIQFYTFSDYAVGLFVYQKVIYYYDIFLHYAV